MANANDNCDRCGARGKQIVWIGMKSLFLCDHDARMVRELRAAQVSKKRLATRLARARFATPKRGSVGGKRASYKKGR